MTTEEAEARLSAIRAAAHDDEVAHGLEDALYFDVLCAIVAMGPDGNLEHARSLAAVAMSSADIDFSRWCA